MIGSISKGRNMRYYNYDDEEGCCGGRDVIIADNESSVLGPDGEPLRKRSGQRIGFDLRAVKRPCRNRPKRPLRK